MKTPKIRKVVYTAKNGCWPYWTKGLAENIGDNLWLFKPYRQDHKVVVETDVLYFY